MTSTDDKLKPTQADRDAAADLLDEISNLLDDNGIGQVADLIRDGEYDGHEATQAFVLHRTTSAPRAALYWRDLGQGTGKMFEGLAWNSAVRSRVIEDGRNPWTKPYCARGSAWVSVCEYQVLETTPDHTATETQVSELVNALREAREALHEHYVAWDGEPEDAVPLQFAVAKCDAVLATTIML